MKTNKQTNDSIFEEVTVTKISGNSVSYSGSEYWNGCDVSNLPEYPEVGKKFLIEHVPGVSAKALSITKINE